MDNTPKLVVGLGNPGPEYDRTRHNVGFEVIDALSRDLQVPVTRRGMGALTGDGQICGIKVYLMKPQTFMNLSGNAVAQFVRNKPVGPSDIMVVSDDINIPVGKLRLRMKGSAGGHNGLKSLVERLGTDEYPRLRLGVGGPPNPDRQIDFVLSRFAPEERKLIDEAVLRAADAVRCWLTDGIEMAMNRFNG